MKPISMKPTRKSPTVVPQIPIEIMLENSGYRRTARYWSVRGRRMTTLTLARLLGLSTKPVARKAAA